MGVCLRHVAMGFALALAPLALAQSPNMQTADQCSSIVTGAGASVNSYCIGITKDALERLHNIAVAGQGRRLFVGEAWLIPAPLFGRPDSGKQGVIEQAFLSLKVTNITAKSLMLTAVKLEILEARNLSKGGLQYSEDTLSPALSMGRPIRVGPGEQAVVNLAEGLELPGMASRIRKNHSLNTAFTLDKSPIRINGTKYVDWFSEQMALLYGTKARLRITLYEGDYIPVAQLSLPLAQGVDFFYHGEAVDKNGKVHYAPRLAYDVFLGEYLQLREIWEPGFRIKRPPTRVIEAIPNTNVPGGMLYRDLGIQEQVED